MARLTKKSEGDRAQMVDVSGKQPTLREAVAQAEVTLNARTLAATLTGGIAKGDPYAAARIAGIMAAKRTPELIPLCHPLPLASVAIDYDIGTARNPVVRITARVRAFAPTGVEMEALTASTVAALTIYDMCKPLMKDISIGNIHLLEKTGGKSGDYHRQSRG